MSNGNAFFGFKDLFFNAKNGKGLICSNFSTNYMEETIVLPSLLSLISSSTHLHSSPFHFHGISSPFPSFQPLTQTQCPQFKNPLSIFPHPIPPWKPGWKRAFLLSVILPIESTPEAFGSVMIFFLFPSPSSSCSFPFPPF